MTPSRFILVLLIFVCALAGVIWYENTPWQGVVFPFIGIVTCISIGAKRLVNFFNSVESVGTEVQRGNIISSPAAPGYFWAGRSLSFKEACQHFLVVGATGSGKSITLNLLMQSVLTKFGQPDERGRAVKRRAVVYDSKADLVSLLGGLSGGMKRLHLLNPLDKRFTPWDISADVTTETDAHEFAAMLIPKNERESSPYFTDTARSLVAGVIKRLISTHQSAHRRNVWSLRDVILAFDSKKNLENLLNHLETRYLMDHFSPGNDKNFAGVKSTADTHLGIYRPIAALLDSSPNKSISLKDWVEHGEGVLVLGNHELSREATDTLNRLILHQLSKAIISRDGVIENDETWIFLDELREAGVLTGLRQLLLRGRSKGVSVAMGFQDVEGIYSAYGEHDGAEIIGAAQNLVALHINPAAPKTAQWTSDVFGSRRTMMSSTSNTSGERETFGQQRQAQLVPNVYPIQFIELPMPSERTGLNFYSYTSADGYRHFTYPWREFLQAKGTFRFVDAAKHPDFQLQRDIHCYKLKPWTTEDFSRLGISPVEHSPKTEQSAPYDPIELLKNPYGPAQ